MGADRIILLTGRGEIRIYDGGSTNYTSIKSAASLAASRTFTLPSTLGSAGQFLQTDGAGGLSWGSSTASTLDTAYDNGRVITSDVGAITINTSTNNQALIINKTGAGAGNVLEIDNDGVGNGILVTQDGAAEAATLNRPTGGLVLRLRASTSGDPYFSVDTNSGREGQFGAANAGSIFLGSGSAHPVEIRTNNTARINIASGAAEVGIGGATVSGVGLAVYGSTTTESRLVGSSGEGSKLIVATGTLSGFTGATMTATAAIPAGAMVQMITFRVQTTITGASTSFDCGVSGALTRYLNGITSGANYNAGTQFRSTINGAQTTPNSYPSNTDLVFTANGSNFTAGAVKYSISYFGPQAPTS